MIMSGMEDVSSIKVYHLLLITSHRETSTHTLFLYLFRGRSSRIVHAVLILIANLRSNISDLLQRELGR